MGTEFCFILLKPSAEITQTFGFQNEIPIFFFRFKRLEPRTIQAVEKVCNDIRFVGRIDPTIAFISSPQSALQEWCSDYVSQNIQSRVLIALSEIVLQSGIDDKWMIVNQIKDQLFIRDFFNYKQPIQSDTFFYGREKIVSQIFDDIKKNQNSGLFGLRKTGKTTVLLRLERLFNKSNLGVFVKIDCQFRPIRKSNCDSIASIIIRKIDAAFSKNFSKKISNNEDVIEVLREAVQSIPKNKRVCVVFDEIEYITPLSSTDTQWASEYFDLFQSIRTIQTDTKKLSIIICGVNPTICDQDRFPSTVVTGRTVQNPLFGIVNVNYLTGFDIRTFINMASFFSQRMGLIFTEDALQYIWQHYGGHPLLSRLACSFHHTQLMLANVKRPIKIELGIVKLAEEDRDEELSNYCEHVVSEMREFYGNEYKVIEAICFDDKIEIMNLTKDKGAMSHLRAYGLINNEYGDEPKITMPVIERYLKNKKRSMAQSGHWRNIVEVENRESWLRLRLRVIAEDFEILNDQLISCDETPIYGEGAPRKISEFFGIVLVKSEEDCISFITKCFKVFVENIDRFYKKRTLQVHRDLAEKHKDLFDAITRIRVYRHFLAHLDLDEKNRERLDQYINKDFDGVNPKDMYDGWFQLQQITLDNLHVAIQRELARM